MKKIILFSIFIYVFSFFANSQVYNIKDATAVVKDMARPCISITFEPDAKDAKKAWKSFLKKKYDFKLKSDKGDDLKAEEVVFPAITSRTMDFYTKFDKDRKENTTTMSILISFGYDVYLNKSDNSSEHSALMGIVKEFSIEFLRSYYNESLQDLNKELSKLSKEKTGTIKENESLANDIEKNKQTVIDLKKENEDKAILIEDNKKKVEALGTDYTKKADEIKIMNDLINGIK